MKRLQQYINDLDKNDTHNMSSLIQEVDAMRKMKIVTQVGLDESEGLFNTVDDRWCRRAKHPLSKTELQNATDMSEFEKGDIAIFEGKEVEVRIPVGPNGTAGIMLEGHLKMVKRDDLEKLDEGFGVMGNMKPLDPLNRIMQLAGLEHSGAVLEDVTESNDEWDGQVDPGDPVFPDTEDGAIKALAHMSTHNVADATAEPDPQVEGVWRVSLTNGNQAIVYLKGYNDAYGRKRAHNDFEDVSLDETEQLLDEADGAGTMFNQLYAANLNSPNYKNNPAAARVATIGQVLAGLQSMVAELPADLPGDIDRQIKMVPGIGANLIKTATAMTKPAPVTGTK